MKNITVFTLITLIPWLLQAQTLKTSVFSSGGGAVQSAGYNHFSTFGQPLAVGALGANYQTREGFIFAQQNILTVTITADETICHNSSASILNSDYTGAEGEVTYQWQQLNGTTWEEIDGEKNDTYNPGALIETTQFRLVVNDKSGIGKVISDPVTINVRDEFTPGAIATTGETICYNTSAAVEIGSETAAGGGDETITYSWRSSADNFTATIIGAVASTYTPGALTQTTSYRRYATDGTCNTTPEQSVGTWTVTVEEELTIECPDNIEVANDPGDCSASVTFAATSGGTPAPVLTYKLDATPITSPHVFEVGTHTVILTAANDCGVVSCTFTVKVNDTEKPNVLCQNIIIDLDATGNATITPADIDNGTTDNCGIATMTLSRTEFDCSDMGNAIPVTLSVTDLNGNTASCTATVTVNELSVPMVRVNITASKAPNGQVKFTAVPVNGGANPIYKWFKNGVEILGVTGDELISTCNSGDEHYVELTSSIPCTAIATSNVMCTY